MSYSKQSMSGHIFEPPKRRPKKFQTLHWSSGCKAAKIGASHPWKCTWTWSPDHADGRKIETDGPMGSTFRTPFRWCSMKQPQDGMWWQMIACPIYKCGPYGWAEGAIRLSGLTIHVMLQDLEPETNCRKLMFHLHDSCRYNWLDTGCFTQRQFFLPFLMGLWLWLD